MSVLPSAEGAPPGPLTRPKVIRALLARHGIRPDRRLGQNFLIDPHALASIVEHAGITGQDTVLEIGPGLGVLTRELCERAREVVSVELDTRLRPLLAETLAGCRNLRLVFQDAMTFPFEHLPGGSLFVANLPYSVATPLLLRALEARTFARLVFLVQREVGERLVAAPGTPAFGALSLYIGHYAGARILRHLGPGAFLPPPEVSSSLVRLDPHPDAEPQPELFALIRDAFAHRRKTLGKSLRLRNRSPRQVAAALEELGLDRNVRAEQLDLGTFRALLAILQRSS